MAKGKLDMSLMYRGKRVKVDSDYYVARKRVSLLESYPDLTEDSVRKSLERVLNCDKSARRDVIAMLIEQDEPQREKASAK